MGSEVAGKFPPRNQESVPGNASGMAYYVMCQLYAKMFYIKDFEYFIFCKVCQHTNNLLYVSNRWSQADVFQTYFLDACFITEQKKKHFHPCIDNSAESVSFVMQPSVSGMDPPFGDAFQNYTFADQALTSTDLLANSSDPDFIYELVRMCRGFTLLWITWNILFSYF